MKDRLKVGTFIEKKFNTTQEMSASRFHVSAPRVVSTPALAGFVQTACVELMDPFLDEGELAVSTRVETSHFSPAFIGSVLKIRVEVIRIDGRNVYFRVDIFDEKEKIASGYNDMFVIDEERFERGVKRKMDAQVNA